MVIHSTGTQNFENVESALFKRYEYAEQHGYEIVGESFDDNVTGMTFNRVGIGKIEDAVESRFVETILVKKLQNLRDTE